jgi:hypothetical protein
MREMALTVTPELLGVAPGTVWGVLLDVPVSGGFATIVALADGTVSMYTSSGGGVIGAGERPEVASAGQRLLAEVAARVELFRDTPDEGLPPTGSVRIHALGPAGHRNADMPVESFWGREGHELAPLIAAAQDVIAAIRRAAGG